MNNDTLPFSKADTTRWSRMVVSFPGWVNVHLMNDSSITYDYKPDTINKRFTITSFRDTLDRYTLNYNEPERDILRLEGKWREDSIFIQLRKEDINRYRMVRWKSHWVNQPNQ
jgi:hypothetical protein